MLQVADATEVLLKDPRVAEVRDVRLRISTLRRRARVVYLPAYVVDYTFGSRFNQHGERTPERFQAVISGMGELITMPCCALLRYAMSCCAVLSCAVLCYAVLCCPVLSFTELLYLFIDPCHVESSSNKPETMTS